jgi:hypothetical protein
VSDHDARHAEIERLPTGPEQRAGAITALGACLRFLESGADTPAELPEAFHDHWFVLAESFVRRMPDLADVSRDAVREWLATERDTAEIFGPGRDPADVVEAVGRFWVGSFVHRVTDELIRWLPTAVRDGSERAHVVTLLEAAAPRLPWRRGLVAVGALRDLGAAEALRRIGTDPDTPAKTREEAVNARRFVDR